MKKFITLLEQIKKFPPFLGRVRVGIKQYPSQPPLIRGGVLAFTLAEVLITLGVIGVVSAITIPTLIQNYKDKVTANKLKKTYSTLANAYQMYLNENGAVEDAFVGLTKESAEGVAKIFVPYLKITKECGTQPGCMYDGMYRYRNGNDWSDTVATIDNKYRVVLSDGSTMYFFGTSAGGTSKFQIVYDVNGLQGPNRYGYDLFSFQGLSSMLRPSGANSSKEEFINSCAKESAQGYGCTAWVIMNENLDYLKCADKIDFEKGKCP